MPVRDIERELEQLNALLHAPRAEALPVLRKALRDRVNLVVSKAAKVAGELQLHGLIPDLCAAFDRLLLDSPKTDPQCWGKNALAKSLRDLGHVDSAVFHRGVEHVQMEPVWGGQEDTAAALRGLCGMALLQCTDLLRDEKLWIMMRLLTERSPSLRKDAAIGLEALGGREAAFMLRVKASMGDNDLSVTGQVLECLLRIEGAPAVSFVLEFMRTAASEAREEAALALGASRLDAAVAALDRMLADKHSPVDASIVFRALAISRHQQALRVLIDVIRSRPPKDALLALQSLHLHRESPEIRNAVASALAERSEPELRREFESSFGPSVHTSERFESDPPKP